MQPKNGKSITTPAENPANPAPTTGRPSLAVQAALFTLNARGELTDPVADIPALTSSSSLAVDPWWFRLHLKQFKRPIKAIDYYMYGLALFQSSVANKALDRLNTTDIANFLG